MKRIYSNEKKPELRKLILMQLSKTRQKIQKEHPGLLTQLQNKMEQQKGSAKASQGSEDLFIDRHKNIESVEKMLNLKESNPVFEKAVLAMLSSKKD